MAGVASSGVMQDVLTPATPAASIALPASVAFERSDAGTPGPVDRSAPEVVECTSQRRRL